MPFQSFKTRTSISIIELGILESWLELAVKTLCSISFLLISVLPTMVYAQEYIDPFSKSEKRIDEKEVPSKITFGSIATAEHGYVSVALINSRALPASPFLGHFCGGALISAEHVLTAGHCVVRKDGTRVAASRIAVGYGALKIDKSMEVVGVAEITIHEDFDWNKKVNDIALLRLSKTLKSDAATPLSISAVEEPYSSGEISVYGWGIIDQLRSEKSEDLRYATLTVQAFSDCNKWDAYRGSLSDGVFCAGSVGGGADACLGDSGGPAIVLRDDKPILTGIVSHGEGCGKPKKFGVYSHLGKFLEWIEEKERNF